MKSITKDIIINSDGNMDIGATFHGNMFNSH